MNADERIALIREKIDRSKKHLDDLATARNKFFDPTPPPSNLSPHIEKYFEFSNLT
jgi:hypothetical protein